MPLTRGEAARRLIYIAYWGALEPLGRSLVLPTVAGLARRGARVTLISFEKARDVADTSRLEACRTALERQGVRWFALRYHKRPTIPATAFDVVQGIFTALLAAREGRLDLIHGRTFIGGVIGLSIRFLLRAPLVYHNEGFWPDQQVEGGFWRRGGLLYRIMKRIELLLYRRADGLIVLSQFSRPQVEQIVRGAGRETPVVVVPSCVDVERFDCANPKARSGGLRLVYVGSLGGRYLVEPLGLFMLAVRRSRPSATLVVLSQSEPDMIRLGLRAAGLDDDAYELSRVPYEEVPARLCAADAGLFFLRGGIGALSCSPTKVGEYWACGLPVVISSGVGDLDAIIRERRVGVIVPELTDAAFLRAADELGRLVTDPGLRARCRKAAGDFYSLEPGLDAQMALYERLRPLGR